jgi:hypothetical protein
MSEAWKAQERPAWCPHSDCCPMRQTQGMACVGELPERDPHGEDFNTHRLCVHGAKDDGEWTFDLKINRTDAWSLRRLLKVVEDERETRAFEALVVLNMRHDPAHLPELSKEEHAAMDALPPLSELLKDCP